MINQSTMEDLRRSDFQAILAHETENDQLPHRFNTAVAYLSLL